MKKKRVHSKNLTSQVPERGFERVCVRLVTKPAMRLDLTLHMATQKRRPIQYNRGREKTLSHLFHLTNQSRTVRYTHIYIRET